MTLFANYQYSIYIAIIVFFVIAFYTIYVFWKRKVITRLIDDNRLRQHIIQQMPRIATVKEIILICAIIISGILLLRPTWGEVIREKKKEGVDMLVALDVSMSMLAKDVKPNRLRRAKDAIKLMAESMKDNRMGLILFAGDAFLQCPLTGDLGALSMFLDSASPDSLHLQGTNIGDAVDIAHRVFSKRRHTSRIFVIITDGEDHEGQIDKAIEQFKDLEVKVYTIGIGRDNGELIPADEENNTSDVYHRDSDGKLIRTRKNPDLLKKIARETGGNYVDITESLSGVYTILNTTAESSKNEYGSRIIKERKEQYQLFAFILAVLLALELMLPGRKRSFR